ncbi:MAG: VPLPA-CTERM sorting domain-containing protein [Syntrophomonas sp.]
MQLGFAPSSQTINQGGTAAVDIIATLGAGEIVSAYDFDIAYNSSIVTAIGVTFGTMLGDELLFEALTSFNFFSGVVDLAEVSFLSDTDLALLQGAGPITLATLFFSGDNPGTSPLSFINYGLGGNDIKGAENIPYDSPILNDGSITVRGGGAPVPIPAAVWLLGSGLIGLVGLRRKFSN